MCFDRALGNVQIAGDFRVVTSLKEQLNDLPFPGPHLAELLFHKHCTCLIAPRSPQVARNIRSRGRIWIRVFASHFAFTRPNRDFGG